VRLKRGLPIPRGHGASPSIVYHWINYDRIVETGSHSRLFGAKLQNMVQWALARMDGEDTSMKTLVVYDSFFGNTEQIARAVGNALSSQTDVETLKVDKVTPEQFTGLELLIVGSPTRAFRPTPAIAKLLRSIPEHGLEGVRVAAFDTRVSLSDINSRILPVVIKLFGYAAKPIADRLKKKDGELVTPPGGFLVDGSEGPLKEGEIQRAADWAKQIGTTQ